ncbi:hypothetical protein KGM_207326 [Danaus plexippus plexippus]|uniref:Uncharacterized protein n=1 Tax=Danaus plexippus plexippus TaxID=278856 RepID=A0A212FDK5_DANPL|nr:hypothetical protein KGM_207326 [Danaus plexippus plexippus]
MKSARSVRSLRSIRSTKSMVEERKAEEFTDNFDSLLVLACSKFNCPYTITVKKETKQDDYYKNLKNVDAKGRVKPRPSFVLQQDDTSKASISNSNNTSNLSEDYSFHVNTITVTVLYDNFNTLTEILITNRKEVPMVLMKVIRILVPFYKNLTKITISNCKIDMYIIYELSKILQRSTIDSVCLDGSAMPLGDFTMLLKTSNLTNLSLCRCSIDDIACELIASMLHCSAPADNLLLLNLSSNQITDVGVKYIANALRTNIRLRYLNLADNHIDDEGAGYILDVLIEFPLLYDEIMKMKTNRLKYLKLKNALYIKYLSEYCNRSMDDLSETHSTSKKKKPKTTAKRDKNKGQGWTNEESVKIRAEIMTAEMLGPYTAPFSPDTIKYNNQYYYSFGNDTLQYLNLAYNNLSYLSLKKLNKVVIYQKTLTSGNRGLTKVVMDGNNLPISCSEIDNINHILGGKIMRFSGRLSEVVRRKGKGSLRIEK